jgi:hypothetical protein
VRIIGVNGSPATTPPALIGGGKRVPLMTVAAGRLHVELRDGAIGARLQREREIAALACCLRAVLAVGPLRFGSNTRKPTDSIL